ncbi:MAG: tRNA preQ1(34) S-adenosylmethionine ribosyltransferase-isomerase QueA [Proteobacteria bacterium]|nr:tRNA preQ1(34) S-adenosylmethionine ribosyltransferase-isomerase QueA [Pseudomonadota bacterium]
MTNLNLLSSYDYELPDSLIATAPAEPRDYARLLVGKNKTLELNKKFYDIVDYLNEGDLVIVNNTKVIPARIFCYRDRLDSKNNIVGKVSLELLLHRPTENPLIWESFAKPAKRLKKGHAIKFDNTNIQAKVLSRTEDRIMIEFLNADEQSLEQMLEDIGHMPLPPYIKRDDNNADIEDYQTVYAQHKGSVAAPTAGLHFTDELIEKIKAKGVDFDTVVLHVGAGTFQPVKTDDITNHKMHSEYGMVTKKLAEKIKLVKQRGNKVIAVGTTSLRILESASLKTGICQEFKGDTDIFIRPGYEFKTVDALITNFHLPKSTLLMLVSALVGYEKTMYIYKEAINAEFKFYSYGDACFLEKNK